MKEGVVECAFCHVFSVKSATQQPRRGSGGAREGRCGAEGKGEGEGSKEGGGKDSVRRRGGRKGGGKEGGPTNV